MSDDFSTKLVLHMTSIGNVEAILESGALMAKSVLTANHVTYRNIAHQEIQERRQATVVPKGSGGVLHDYVPFYFAGRSPMLYAIKNNSVAGVVSNQDDIVYWVCNVNNIVNSGCPFVFTDGHGTMNFTGYFDDVQFLDQIDWDVMQAQYWSDTVEDPDRKRRRQAEFLVYQSCPLNMMLGLGVKSDVVRLKVESMVEKAGLSLKVVVKPDWYF